MDKIAELLEKLENKVTPTFAKRLDGLKSLENKLELAKKDLEASPDDEELKESHQEIVDYIEDYREDLIDDLEALVEAKQKAKASEQKSAEEKKLAEEQKAKESIEPKEEVKEKESSTNIAGWIFGGLLLVGSLGAINYFRNNR
jgi:DNA polymerase III alpha subunit (gram-positive type)